MISTAWANQTIPAPDGKYHHHKPHYSSHDIIDLMILAERKALAIDDTKEFATAVTPDAEGMEDLFNFIVDNIRYVKDPAFSQWVKSPARLWHDRKGDCKSYTLFITSVLRNMGMNYVIRFVSYNRMNATPRHVYPVAILPDGKEVVMDAVWGQHGGRFDSEKPYKHKKDYKMKQGLAYLSGVEDNTKAYLEALVEIDNRIPDSVLNEDITEMNQGQLLRFQEAQRLEAHALRSAPNQRNQLLTGAQALRAGSISYMAGSANTRDNNQVINFIRETSQMKAPAFHAPTLRINLPDEEIAGFLKGIGKFFQKVGRGIGKGVKAVGEFFKKAWAKLMNWIFKDGLLNAGPFFLFQFLRKTVNKEVARRKDSQSSELEWMVKLGLGRDNIRKALKNGVIKHFGQEPEAILNSSAGQDVAGIGFAPALVTTATTVADGAKNTILEIAKKALKWIVDIVKKIATLFKKDKAPALTTQEVSDPALLKEPGGGNIAPLVFGAAAIFFGPKLLNL